ncbi:MAG: hypothetical protein RLZZ440_1118 [Planctomycetota bacterium]
MGAGSLTAPEPGTALRVERLADQGRVDSIDELHPADPIGEHKPQPATQGLFIAGHDR